MVLFARRSTPFETQQLEHLINADDPSIAPVVRLRAQAILLSQQRSKPPQIAQNLHVHRDTVAHWIKRFNHEGIAVLSAMPTRHPPLFVHAVTEAEQRHLHAIVADESQPAAVRKRAEGVLLSIGGASVVEIAAILKVSERQIRLWLSAYLDERRPTEEPAIP